MNKPNITGYEIGEKLHEGLTATIYRAIRRSDQEPVIIKLQSGKFVTFESISKFRNEFNIGSQFDSPHIIKYLSVENSQQGLAIVTEDFGGTRLSEYIPQKGLPLKDFFDIALKIAEGLNEIHAKKVIYKDLKPNNIVIHSDSRQIKFIDFGLSTQHEMETQHQISLNKLEGTLEYISPEQTGRMNRTIDYRTDFYSLGITFYQLLCGKLPFESKDHLELIHCHIAKKPPSPSTVRKEIPEAVSGIIMKLLEKNAEDRYQSTIGLISDIEKCRNCFEDAGQIPLFELGEKDFSERFIISQKLYGREKEIKQLLDAFERTSKGKAEMLLVNGYSGVGKSSLINEVQKPIVSKWGYFITGKFDQFNRKIAYSAIGQACEDLMNHILGENESRIISWREKLLHALGQNGQIIIDLIPSVKLLIGEQPPVQELGSVESQNRFNHVFMNFMRVFCKKEHPLVLFLDDLQNADSASLNILHLLATDTELQHFMLIGSYRDNEVDNLHPLSRMIAEIEKARGVIEKIFLKPLNKEHTNQLIADALGTSLEVSLPLTHEIYLKTEGNAFFVKLFLQTLNDEKHLTFVPAKGWRWDMSDIHRMQATENVADLMLKRLNSFPKATQEILKVASCLGNVFTTETLVLVSRQNHEAVLKALKPVLNIGMVLQTEEKLRFVHDRVQEAAYRLLPVSQREKIHFEIGNLLLENLTETQRTERIFEIVDHLNFSLSLIEEGEKKLELADLNLIAGRKAKKNTAYASSLRYFSAGMECLPKNRWEPRFYNLTFSLYRERAEAEYLNGNMEKSQTFIREIQKKAVSISEKTSIYCMLIYQYTVLAEYKKGVEAGRNALKLLGIELPTKNMKAALEEERKEAEKNLGGRKIESLIDSPDMTSPEHIAAMKVMMEMQPTTYMSDPELYSLLGIKLANLSLKYGHIHESAKAYVTYANILSSVFGEYQLGHKFCILGLEMSEKYEDMVQKCRGSFIYIAFLLHWTKKLRMGKKVFLDGYRTGIECGDFQYAGYILGFGSANIFNQGTRLESLGDELTEFMTFVQKAKHQMPINAIQAFQLAIANLQGKTSNELSFDTATITETEFIQRCESRNVIGKAYFLVLKAQILYLYGFHSEAHEAIILAEENLDYIRGTSSVAEFNFYHSLILAAILPDAPKKKQREYLGRIRKNQEQMRIWADNCKENFEHKFLLVEAELARLSGEQVETMSLYDQAIQSAAENEFMQNEALANELAAHFWYSQKKEEFGDIYLKYAYHRYQLWGATRKVESLEGKHPKLSRAHHPSEGLTISSIDTTISSTIHSSSNHSSEGATLLDLGSVIKASQTISGEIVLENLLKKLMRIVIENAGAQRGFLITKIRERLVITAEASIDDDEVEVSTLTPVEETQDLSRSIINYVDRTIQNVVLSDATKEGLFTQDSYVIANKPKSILCFPILNQGKSVGIIYLENNISYGAFTPDRLQILSLISSQAAISIENAHLYRNMERLVQERTRELSSATEELQNTLEELKLSQNQLVESEKMASLGILVAGVAHEINTPIGIGTTAASHLQDCTKNIVSLVANNTLKKTDFNNYLKDAEQASDLILKNLKRTAELVSSFKMVSADQQVLDRRKFLIKAYIEDIVRTLSSRFKQYSINLEIVAEDTLEVNGFPGAIAQIITNFVMNSLNHAYNKNDKGNIRIEVTSNKKEIVLRYSDDGKGIPLESQKKIFDPFYTTNRAGGGTGLGLHIVFNLITQKLSGKVKVESEVGKGTTFIVTFPASH